MIVIKQRGNFKNTERFFKNASSLDYRRVLQKYGDLGVKLLQTATPRDSGKTADAWDYFVKVSKTSASISWTNSNINNGVPIAILLQYGHGNGNGGYVEGRDYINPTLKPIFDQMADDLWKEVTR